jgi:hypothetical protein
MAANKKLTKTIARCNLAPQGSSGSGGRSGEGTRRGPKAILGNYCWTHEYKVLHTSKTCNVIGRKLGHDEAVTGADTKGGADFNKDWYLQGNQAPWWWGIASDLVSNNNLLNLQNIAVMTLDSSNHTLHPTNNDSGIADSGLTGFYFGPDTPVNNYDATAPTIEVHIANGTPV